MDMVAAVCTRDGLHLGLRSSQQLGEGNASVAAHLIESPHHILCGQISRGTGGKGAASQTTQSSLHLGNPHIHGRQGVGHAQAAGIMEVDHQIQTGICVLHGADHCAHLGGIGNADSIAQAAGLHTGVHIVFQKIYRGGGIALVANGCKYVVEGANMPTTLDATTYLQENGVLFMPGKAANAGGVAVSALEMSQNSMRYNWTSEEVDEKLHNIMKSIFNNSVAAAEKYGLGFDLIKGANIAGFEKVVEAMISQGIY